MYIPKTKYKTLYSSGGEFVYQNNKSKPFKGAYIEMSDGKYLEGSFLNSRGDQEVIIRSSTLIPVSITKTNNSKQKLVYDLLKAKVYKYHKKVKPLTQTKELPTKKDYEKGKFKRYFSIRKNNIFGYKEINKEIYDSIKQQDEKYDHHLYKVDFINWNLKEGYENEIIIEDKEIKYPELNLIFQNQNEYILPLEINPTITDIIDEEEEIREKEIKPNVGFYPEPISSKSPINAPTQEIQEIHQQLMNEVRYKLKNRTPKPNNSPKSRKIHKNILERAKQRSLRGVSPKKGGY